MKITIDETAAKKALEAIQFKIRWNIENLHRGELNELVQAKVNIKTALDVARFQNLGDLMKEIPIAFSPETSFEQATGLTLI